MLTLLFKFGDVVCLNIAVQSLETPLVLTLLFKFGDTARLNNVVQVCRRCSS